MAGKKKAKKATKKKAGKKKLKAKSNPNPEGPDVEAGGRLHKLGLYAEKNKNFRKNVASKKGFRLVYIAEQLTHKNELDVLTEEEIGFCQGWLYMAESEFTIDYEAQVLAAIQKHLHTGGGYHPFSG